MSEFVTVATFTSDALKDLKDVGASYQAFQRSLQQQNCRITKAYTALGDIDVIFTIEAPDATTLQVALVNATTEWPIHTKTYTVTPVNEFISQLDRAMAQPAGARR